jgi:5'-3' exonuclease
MWNIIINNNYPIILIDCSYYIFYRYFATIKWFKFKEIDIDPENIENNDIFLEAIKKHFNNDIKKIIKKYKTIYNNIYFCLDCSRDNIWRNNLYTDYKSGRVTSNQFNNKIFDLFINKFNIDIPMISLNKLEADDVVAIIHKNIRKLNNTKDIIIITNDNDYIQLFDKNTTIINMNFKDITLRNKELSVDNYLIFKILLGDKVDNIKKIGKINKNHIKEILNNNDLENWLKLNNLYEQYEKNRELIDFNYIPIELINELLNNINFI